MTTVSPVIAVSGVPGSGKSTLARALARALGAPLVAYDDFERMTARPPEAIEAWIHRGAPIAEIPVPGLGDAVARLRRGEAVPGTGAPGPAVILDTLVGRAHPDTAGLIDLLLWIEVPLDVALARKLGRMVAGSRGRAGDLVAWLEPYLGHYTGFVRSTYLMQQESVAPGADATLDGLLPPADLAQRALAEVKRRLPGLHPRGSER